MGEKVFVLRARYQSTATSMQPSRYSPSKWGFSYPPAMAAIQLKPK